MGDYLFCDGENPQSVVALGWPFAKQLVNDAVALSAVVVGVVGAVGAGRRSGRT